MEGPGNRSTAVSSDNDRSPSPANPASAAQNVEETKRVREDQVENAVAFLSHPKVPFLLFDLFECQFCAWSNSY